MDDEPIDSGESQATSALEIARDSLPKVLEMLLEQQDFTDSPELFEARRAIIAGLGDSETNPQAIQTAWTHYSLITERIAEQATDLPRAQIAAIIHKALIFKEAGLPTEWLRELDIAEVYASNAGFDEIKDALQTEIDRTIDSLEMSPAVFVVKLKGLVSEPNREHLRDLVDDGDDLDDMIGDAYAMILDEGDDPDEVFESLGLTE